MKMSSNENMKKSSSINQNLNNIQQKHHQHEQQNQNNQQQTLIPMNRVRTIMKSSPEIANINPDTLFLVCKATVKKKFSPNFIFFLLQIIIIT